MNDWFTKRQEQVVDRYLQSTYGLWSAILTINGILLASLLTVGANKGAISNCIVIVTAISCVLSLVFVVYNFVAMKRTYYRIAEVMEDEHAELTDEQKKKDTDKALSRQKIVSTFEEVCLFLLLLEALMVLFLIIYSVGFGE